MLLHSPPLPNILSEPIFNNISLYEKSFKKERSDHKGFFIKVNHVVNKYLGVTRNVWEGREGERYARGKEILVRGGLYNYSNGSLDLRGSYGYYWESKVYSATNAYYLLFYSTLLFPQNNYNKGNGFSARCVAR